MSGFVLPRMNRMPAPALTALAALSGCGGGRTETREIVFWQFTPVERVQPTLDAFEREHPGLHVRMEQLTWDSGQEELAASIAGGTLPDLCEPVLGTGALFYKKTLFAKAGLDSTKAPETWADLKRAAPAFQKRILSGLMAGAVK